MFGFKNIFLEFWSKITSMFSRLAGVFGFKRKAKKMNHVKPKKPKVPKVQGLPTITEETEMELSSMDLDDPKIGRILEKSEKIAKKTGAPEPLPEPLSNEEAKNIAKMLPLFLALGMAKAGPEEEVRKPKGIEEVKESMDYFMLEKGKSATEYTDEPVDAGKKKKRAHKDGSFSSKETQRNIRPNSR